MIIVDDIRIKELASKGYSAYKISRILPYSVTGILGYFKRHSIPTKKCSVNRNNMLKDKKQLVIDLYKQHRSITTVARMVGHSQGEICKLLKPYNIVPSRYIYNVDESFFNTINTPEKAYVLGWWFSDGYISKSNGYYVAINLQVSDKEILEKIANIMGYTGPIKETPPRVGTNEQGKASLVITRKSLFDALNKLGCVERKSNVLQFPPENIVPAHLIRHFLRGFWDGDGSLIYARSTLTGPYKYLYCNLSSTPEFLNGVQQVLLRLGVTSTIRMDDRCSNNALLKVSNTSNTMKIFDWLYQDATIYLQRKYDKYQQWLKVYNNIAAEKIYA